MKNQFYGWLKEKLISITQNNLLIIFTRLILGSIFLTSGLTKILGDIDFIGVVSSYNLLPAGLSSLYGTLLPWAELLIGSLLIMGLFRRISAAISFAMVISFMIANTYAIWGSCPASDGNCGCLGTTFIMDHEVSMVVDIVMFFMAVLLFFSRAKQFNLKRLFSALFKANSYARQGRGIPARIMMGFLALIVVLPGQLLGSFPASAGTDANDPIVVPQNQIEVALDTGKPVFAYFYLDTCTYCQKQKPVIDELETEYDEEVVFLRIAGDMDRELAKKFKVNTYPSILFIYDQDASGNYIYKSFTGFTDQKILQDSLDYYLQQNNLPDDSINGLTLMGDTAHSDSFCTDEGSGEVMDSSCQMEKHPLPEDFSGQAMGSSSGSTLDTIINAEFESGKYVFLFFYAEWCHYCQDQHPIIDELEAEYGDKITFIRADSARYADDMAKWNITGFPSMFLITGMENDTYIYLGFGGFTTKYTLSSKFDYLLENGSLPDDNANESEDLDVSDIDRNIDIALIEGNPVFLFFYSDSCSYCEQQFPIIDELELVYQDNITFIRAEGSECPDDLVEWGVTGFPSMFLVVDQVDGSYIYREFGVLTEKEIITTVFDQLLETGSLPEETLRTGYVHHSCSLGKCYANCIAEKFQFSDLLSVERFMTDVVLDCFGDDVVAREAYKNAYAATKAGDCAYTCGTADTPREYGNCTQCIIENTLGKIKPIGCAVDLWNFLGDLLEPHADCLAECAAPSSTWEKNWGHTCRDDQDYSSRCAGPNVMESLSCDNCEWSVSKVYICDEGCEMTADGAVCKGKCNETDCNDNNPCTIDWCYKGECKYEWDDSNPECEKKCPESCDDGDPCTTDYCDQYFKCQHAQMAGCCTVSSCYSNDPCVVAWCESGRCWKQRVPGCDKPDDNNDVSTPYPDGVPPPNPDSKIAVLNTGFAPYLIKIMGDYGHSAALLDISLAGAENYPFLFIPSGGLAGLDSSESFKTALENYTSAGGTVIVFAQQQDNEFEALPGGEVRGVGWANDQSCHAYSAGISTYHPMFSGQMYLAFSLDVDGYFTAYPENAELLLLRTRNGSPAMIMYEYGNGRVLATTSYSDMSADRYIEPTDARKFMRDLFAWVTSSNDIKTYGPNEAQISIPVTNVLGGPGVASAPEFSSGDLVEITYSITNPGSISADTVKLHISSPSFQEAQIILAESIPPGESRQVTLSYQTSVISEPGIWTVLYFLYSGEDFIQADVAGKFTLNHNSESLSNLQVYLTVKNPLGEIFLDETYPLSIPPGETRNLDFSVTSELWQWGIWSARYSVLWEDGTVLMSSEERFAMNKFSEATSGWVYQGEDIEVYITTPDERPAYYTDVTFTVHAVNNGNTGREISFLYYNDNYYPTLSWAQWSCDICRFGEECSEPACVWKVLNIPANSAASFDFTNQNVYGLYGSAFDVYFYDEIGNNLGWAIRGIQPYSPEVKISVDVDKSSYGIEEGIPVSVIVETEQLNAYSATINVELKPAKYGSPAVETQSYGIFLDGTSGTNRDERLLTMAPPGSFGNYYVCVEAIIFEHSAGQGSDYFMVAPQEYELSFLFDKEDQRYSTGEQIGLAATLKNISDVASSWDVEISSPDLNLSESGTVSPGAGESSILNYVTTIPESITADRHSVFVTVTEDGKSTNFEFYFYIPNAQLALSVGAASFNAGENATVNVANNGGVGTAAHCSIELLNQVNPLESDITINAGEQTSLTLPLPLQLSTGNYWLKATCLDNSGALSQITEAIQVQGSEIELSITDTENNAGDEVVITLNNASAINTSCDCGITLTDTASYSVYEAYGIIVPVSAGSTAPLSFNIPGQTASGIYKLDVVCTDQVSSKVSNLNSRITVTGLSTGITSTADKDTYLISEQITIDTDMVNSSQPVLNGNLNLKIWEAAASASIAVESWVARYAGGAWGEDKATAITADGEGNVYVTGPSYISGSGVFHDYATVKYGSSGNELWVERYNGTGNQIDWPVAIAVDTSGNVYVTGHSDTLNTTDNKIYYDIVTIKYNSDGEEQWQARYNGPSGKHDYPAGISIDDAGNIYIAGTSYDDTGFNDIVTIKYESSNGTELWAQRYNGEGNEIDGAAGLEIDNTGNVYVAGTSGSGYIAIRYLTDSTQDWVILYDNSANTDTAVAMSVDSTGNVYIAGNSGDSIFVTRVDSDGSTGWSQVYSGPTGYIARAVDIGISPDGNIYVSGKVSSGEGNVQWLTIKYNSDGSQDWSQIYIGTGNYQETPVALVADSTGVYITGVTYGAGSYQNYATIKYSTVGFLLWVKTYNGPASDSDIPGGIALDSNDNIYVIGGSWGSSTGYDFATVKYAQIPGEPLTVLWEKDIPISLGLSEIKNIATVVDIPTELAGVTGKLYHSATLYSGAGQVIDRSEPDTFYIVDSNLSLNLDTDKDLYRPGETVTISGAVHNSGTVTEACTLTLSKDGMVIHTESFSLPPGGDFAYSTTTSADSSFSLQATVNGVVVDDTVTVEPYNLNLNIVAPDIAGLAPFNVGIILENQSSADYEVDILLVDVDNWHLIVPEGETIVLETSTSITEDSLLTVNISGDVVITATRTILMGERALLQVEPDITYFPGPAAIPFSVNNSGLLDVDFAASFSLDSQPAVEKQLFAPAGKKIMGEAKFDLTPGNHILEYNSPYGAGTVDIYTVSDPQIIITELPSNLNLVIGDPTWTFKVKNIGGSPGEVTLSLQVPDWEETQYRWLYPGEESEISFKFMIPDDLEEKSYRATYQLNGEEGEFVFFVQGAKVSVTASLDKNLYMTGDRALLDLNINNISIFDLDLFLRVQLGDYEEVVPLTLAAGVSQSVSLSVPVVFNRGKLSYGIYMSSGRALYLNALYIHERQPLGLWTDKQVYDEGETVTVFLEPAEPGTLVISAPGYEATIPLTGNTDISFVLPELRTGTYYIHYQFNSVSGRYPFDVRGYSARITEFKIDENVYNPGEPINISLRAEVRPEVATQARFELFDRHNQLVDQFNLPLVLVDSWGKIEIERVFVGSGGGKYWLLCTLISSVNESEMKLTSAVQYFDSSVNEPPEPYAGQPYFATEGANVIFDIAGSTDPNADILQYRWDFDNDGMWDTDWSQDRFVFWKWHDNYKGIVVLEATDGEYSETSYASVTIENVAPTVYAGYDITINKTEAFLRDGFFSDPGTNDTWTATADYGDGTSLLPLGLNVDKTFTLNHNYSSSGTYEVIIAITDDDGGIGTGTFFVTVTESAIDIEKTTDGQDADTAPGPYILVGQSVNWSYIVTNTGDVQLTNITVTDDQGVAVSCPKTTLEPGESMTCMASGTAVAGQYANLGTVAGNPPEGDPVTDSDPSHYFGAQPSISIEKYTNGENADAPPGPIVTVGNSVTWTYEVRNTGNITLTGVSVTDDQGIIVSCPQSTLQPDESMVCMASGTVVAGQYSNIGMVTANPPGGLDPVNASDPSHYFGEEPRIAVIDIEKSTNGQDADTAPGPIIPVGQAVNWSYVVTNTGDVQLTNITVTDDQGVAVSCPKTTLESGESMTCMASGTAVAGQYANLGTVAGNPPEGDPVTDSDPTHYFGAQPGIDLEKYINSIDADVPPGPVLMISDNINFDFVVTNTGNVELTNIVVTDDVFGQIGIIESLAIETCYLLNIVVPAEAGQHTNTGTAVADEGVSDSDSGNYFGEEVIEYEGLTPGFWKNHTDLWMDYSPEDPIGEVFNIPEELVDLADDTLLQALGYDGGGKAIGMARNLLRAAVAALLNASHPDVSYPLTRNEIVNAVNDALLTLDRHEMELLKDELDRYNNLGGGINAHGNPI